MKIEHIAIWTKDLDRAREYYVKYFHGKCGEKYYNHKTGFQSYFIVFDIGTRLEIMTVPSITKLNDNDNYYIGYAHMAFSVGSKEKVDQLTNQLRMEGYKIVSGPRVTGDGYYESCVLDPDGNRVEITT